MFNIYEKRTRFLLLPIAIIVIGIIFGIFRGGFNVDTEFSGGTRLHVAMQKQFSNVEVAKTILDKTGVSAVVQKTGNGTKL